jgi:hypothetical protein
MPTASFAHTARTTRTVDEVWAALQSEQTWSRIGPVEEVWDPVVVDGALRSFSWRTTVGPTSYRGSAVVRDASPNRMHLDLDAGEIAGSLTADLAAVPGGDGTAVTVTLVVTSRGMLSTLFFPVVTEAVSSGLPRQVDEFAAAL